MTRPRTRAEDRMGRRLEKDNLDIVLNLLKMDTHDDDF